MLAVMIFMLVYYRGAGINADLALILNLVILLGFMGFTGSTLTLPGIAGVILTIGMGVDSNVLIFERIREELRAGQDGGGGGAAGLCACLGHHHRYPRDDDRFGGDPVPVRHGSGAGLCGDAGLRSSCQPVYGGVCLARHLRRASCRGRSAARRFRFRCSCRRAVDGRPLLRLPAEGLRSVNVELFRNTNIDWLGKKWYFLGFSLIFSVAGVLSMLFWHHIPLGVDFKGGTQIRVAFDQRRTRTTSARRWIGPAFTTHDPAGQRSERTCGEQGDHRAAGVDGDRSGA